MIKFLKNGSAKQKNNQKRKRLPFEGSLFFDIVSDRGKII